SSRSNQTVNNEPNEDQTAVEDPPRNAQAQTMDGTERTTTPANQHRDALQRIEDRPTIIIVPGAWHFGTKHYNALTERLEVAGYKVIPLDMPSVCDDPPLTGWKDDIAHIAQTIEQAADRGEDVLLVMHSRGGHCGSDAAQGFGKTDREKAGKKGGIVRLVFLSAFAAPEGISIFFATNGVPPWVDVKHSVCTPMRVEEIFYNDCTPEQIEAASRDITPMSTLCLLLPVTYAAWKHIPSTYLVCGKDNAIP
ncbi:hypothetical protein LTR82_018341, partial [Friedmanniomyces endolithicus]